MKPKKYYGPRGRGKHGYDIASDRVDKMTQSTREAMLKKLELLSKCYGLTVSQHHELRALKAMMGRRE